QRLVHAAAEEHLHSLHLGDLDAVHVLEAVLPGTDLVDAEAGVGEDGHGRIVLRDGVRPLAARALVGPRRLVYIPPPRDLTASPFSWPDPLGREDTMRPRFRPLDLALLIALAWLVAAPASSDAQSPKRGGTLRVSYGNEIANLDFHTAPGYEMMWVAMNIGCGLVNITPDGKFVGDAAESWTVSPDGLLYNFKLRKNVLFHDGTPVDAAAVKFSIDRLMDPATKSGMRPFYEPLHTLQLLDP